MAVEFNGTAVDEQVAVLVSANISRPPPPPPQHKVKLKSFNGSMKLHTLLITAVSLIQSARTITVCKDYLCNPRVKVE